MPEEEAVKTPEIVIGNPVPEADPDADKWEISFKGWKVKDKRKFVKASQEVGETGDEEALFPYFAQIIKRWPYKLNPADVASYEELEYSQFMEASRRVVAAFQKFVQPTF